MRDKARQEREEAGILSAELLGWLPRGACLVNAARGQHLDEAALLVALDEGRLAGAVLDVLATEPLPPDSPLWAHPAVRITPHVSSITDVPNGAAQIADNYRRLLAGRPLVNVADRSAGY
ncbi:Glyoxylate/hydroxypyruvate reductase A [Tetrabaena socialis]|uniref:Glyoxylate/hydroxypyruvate reductase A n=1 Tax=Tetrabaena socialis TaxID=47790 RepID=A0A2J7ZN35_9CHLO|nr:Glyoxylate/hydroxypyruvate reductase A [Tetrabaena socialis]|eukprot:PNH01675.1 Glyoxylate/hydroxypyruvate reductase A [Tetrabaena socialis]